MATDDVREIGRVPDLYGAEVIVGVDHAAVTIDGPKGITIGPDARDDFARLYFQADEAANWWMATQPDDDEQVTS